jgi:ankyrin repeat protein
MRKVVALLILFNCVIFSVAGQDTVLIESVRFARLLEIMKDYNSRSIYIDKSDYVEQVPDEKNINLQTASLYGFCGEIVRLVTEGANINSISPDKTTPLHFAVSGGHKDAAEIILILGGDPNALDAMDKTPLAVAVENDDIETAELLIKYGANSSLGDFHGLTPLHFAVRNESFYMVDMLLYYNVNTDDRDKKGDTPLMYSVWKKNCEIADLLLKAGANPNIADKNGYTPFMFAAQNGDTLMLKLLNDAGADIYATNTYGYDAYSIAIRYGQGDAIKFLRKIGNLWFEKKPGKVDPNMIALEFGKVEALSSDYSVPLKYRLSINKAALSAGGVVTNHLALVTGGVSFRAPLIRSGIFAEYTFSPVKSRVLVKSDDIIYQYFVDTRIIEGGVFHDWSMGKGMINGNLKFHTALSGAYKSYSKYYGSITKPENQFCIVPSAGITYSIHSIGFAAELKYIKTPFYKMAPVWFGLKFSVNFLTDHTSAPGKQINISSNE